jgi:Kef-type K+ transport system membrane component KefB
MNAGGTAAAAGALVSPLKNASSNVPAPSGADKVITAKLIDNEQNEYVLSKTKGGNALLVDHFLGGDLEVIALGCVLAVLFASLAGQHRANGFMLTGLVVGPGGLALLRQFVQLDAIARIGSLLLTYYIGSRMSRRTKLGHKDQRSFRSMVLRLIAVGFGRAVVLSLVFAAIFHWIMPWTHAQCAIVGSALAFSHCGTRFDFLTREHKLAKSMVAIEHYTMVGQNVYFVLVLLLHVVLKNTLSVGADLKERYADRQWASVGAISWCMLQTIVIVFGLVALCLMLRPSVKRMILESRFVHVNGLAVAFPFAFGSVLTGVLEVLIAQVVRVEYNTDILLLGAFLSGFVLSYGEWVLTHRPTERHIFGISALDIENGETGESSRWQSALTTSSKGQNGLSFGLAFEAIFYASLGMLIRVAALRDDARLIASLLLLGSGGKLLLGLASARLVGKAGSSAMGLAVRAAMPGEFTFLLLSHGLAAEELGKPVAQAAACVMFTSCVVYSTALSLSHK